MFLRPHHFQAAGRNFADVVRQQIQWDNHYSWGLRSIDIDNDALRNYRFVIHRLRARLRDGTVIWKGQIATLRRFKDDVREVRDGFECGIGLENYQDLKPGDVIETFEEREIARV
jgi:hypothetical protein